ncbi:hypothetical protein, partial [Methanoregula sp.]|uniref:hypothetical protein n=1 Tax=Methanoregula sp. TaxID=2052170 RepID=UPI003C75F7C4
GLWGSSGNSANARQNSLYKSLFSENDRFNQEKTVQFISVFFIAKKREVQLIMRDAGRARNAFIARK